MESERKTELLALKDQFKHLDIQHELKDRLIWQYLSNRERKRDFDNHQNEVDTDWGN